MGKRAARKISDRQYKVNRRAFNIYGLDEDLKSRLIMASEINQCSLSAEIVKRLEESFTLTDDIGNWCEAMNLFFIERDTLGLPKPKTRDDLTVSGKKLYDFAGIEPVEGLYTRRVKT